MYFLYFSYTNPTVFGMFLCMNRGVLILICVLLRVSPVFGQGIHYGTDVPCPREYEVRTLSNGQRYVMVRKFERRVVKDVYDWRDAGVVTRVHRRARLTYVTLQASNGRSLAVRVGHAFSFRGRRFKAVGFQGRNFIVRCQQTGRRFAFRS